MVPDLERGNRASFEAAAFDKQLGPLVKQPEGDAICGLDLFKRAEASEDAAERSRLLYVATTRAADYLILSSGVMSVEKPKGAWRQLLAERFDLATGACLAALPAGYTIPLVKVITSEPPLDTAAKGDARRPHLADMVQQVREQTPRQTPNLPVSVATVSADRQARRVFSFSSLNDESDETIGFTAAGVLKNGEDGGTPTSQEEAIQLGTLIHAVLANWDFAAAKEATELKKIKERVTHHADRLRYAPDGDFDEGVAMVERFVRSSRAAELAQARCVHRELEFLMAWPPEAAKAGGQQLHGFIDCLYEDALGRWHLVDYKTSRVSAKTMAQVAAGYEMQMLLYAWAAELVLRTPPTSLVLYFLRTGGEYFVEWSPAARDRVGAFIEQKMKLVAGR